MKLRLLISLGLLMLVSFQAIPLQAESKLLVCAKKSGQLTVKKNCKRLPQVCNNCSPCGTDLSGEWSYRMMDKNNQSSAVRTITLAQTGDAFSGSATAHTILGKVTGNWVRMTFTVSGEEAEGWIALAEGTVYERTLNFQEGPQERTYMNVVVLGDTFGHDNASYTAGIFWRINN